MINVTALDTDPLDADPVADQHARQRAALDLQRIIGTLAQRYLVGSRRKRSPEATPSLTWRTLLVIDEQAFGDLGFQSRHDPAVRAAFIRLVDSRLPSDDLDALVNWQRDDDDLPAAYLIVRALLQADTADATTSF